MQAQNEDVPFPEFVLRWWEEGERLHEDPFHAAAVMKDVAPPESSPIWLLAVWVSLASLVALGL